jgi:branched-subunit amino acid ABC-type transport system permease component
MTLTALTSTVLTGLTSGMLVFLVASGLTLIFGALKILNFAHGVFYMLGAYLAYSIVAAFVTSPAGFWTALVLAPLGVALVGGIIERFVLRRVYDREHIDQLLLTYALVLIIADVARYVWGVEYKSIPRPAGLDGSIELFGTPVATYYVLVLVLAPAIALGLYWTLQKTRLGWMIRAATFNREMAGALGINVPRLFLIIFMVGSWLGGLGGALYAPLGSIVYYMHTDVLMESFLVMVIGGVGNFWGAFVGSIIFGLLNAFGYQHFPRFSMFFAFALMATVLLVRPWGLLGRPER